MEGKFLKKLETRIEFESPMEVKVWTKTCEFFLSLTLMPSHDDHLKTVFRDPVHNEYVKDRI